MMFWHDHAEQARRRAQLTRLLAELRAVGLVDVLSHTHWLDPAVAAAAAARAMPRASAVASKTSADAAISHDHHALLSGDSGGEFMRKLKWLDMLQLARLRGAEQLVVFDATDAGGSREVDVTLALYAAQLDVLDALAPALRHEQLVDQTKSHLHAGALRAMADKDSHEGPADE